MKKALEPFDSRAFDNQSTAHMRASDSSSSSIRTVTVGSGFSPDQPCLHKGRGLRNCFLTEDFALPPVRSFTSP